MEDTFLTNVNKEQVTNLLNQTNENAQYFQDITSKVVNSYTSSLDEIMKNIYKEVVEIDNPPIDVLEKYFLELTNCIYFMGEKLETLGIYDSLSKSAYKEVYNNAYLGNIDKDAEKKNKKTVAELTSIAEGVSIYESTVNDIYSSAYKIVKNKVDSAQTMVSTLSKVISRRMSEIQLSNTKSGLQILNE